MDGVKVSKNLRELRMSYDNGKSLSHARLAEELRKKYEVKISEQTLKDYERAAINESTEGITKGNAICGMRIEYLDMFADFYGVSADYILGRNDIESPDVSLQAACAYTGLSQKAVDNILYWSEDSTLADTLDEFLSFRGSSDFFYAINDVLTCTTGIPFQWESYKDSFSAELLDEVSTLEYYLKELKYSIYELSESATSLVSNIGKVDELMEKLSTRIEESRREQFEKKKNTGIGEERNGEH